MQRLLVSISGDISERVLHRRVWALCRGYRHAVEPADKFWLLVPPGRGHLLCRLLHSRR
jgi:hypothetical protein